jgi:hypothetical protein
VAKNQLQVAFEMGHRSFYKGVFDAPYKDGTVLLKEWQRGFDTAYFQNADALRTGNAPV